MDNRTGWASLFGKDGPLASAIHQPGLCKDCKWWNILKNEADGVYGECALTHRFENSLFHESKAVALAIVVELEVQKAATLLTLPDFGCVQFEAKETQ